VGNGSSEVTTMRATGGQLKTLAEAKVRATAIRCGGDLRCRGCGCTPKLKVDSYVPLEYLGDVGEEAVATARWECCGLTVDAYTEVVKA